MISQAGVDESRTYEVRDECKRDNPSKLHVQKGVLRRDSANLASPSVAGYAKAGEM